MHCVDEELRSSAVWTPSVRHGERSLSLKRKNSTEEINQERGVTKIDSFVRYVNNSL